MKGIILAGGSGSRLYPLTKCVSKQLLPVYDKPMIYYPLSILMLSGIKEVLIISTQEDIPRFEQLLGDGAEIGMQLSYKVQPSPDGLAQAFILGKDFIANEDVSLILGDNIFYGQGLTDMLIKSVLNAKENKRATIFGYHVKDPDRYGVVDFNSNGKVISIEEKPKKPKSNYAVTGLYFYPNDVIAKAEKVLPSERGELEITSINQMFLDEDRVNVELMGRGFAWLDTGTHESLLEASAFIETIEKRQALKVGCIEEIAFESGLINKDKFIALAQSTPNSGYGKYLLRRAKEMI